VRTFGVSNLDHGDFFELTGPGKVDLSMRMPGGAVMTTHVTETAAAPSELAVRHFEEMLAFETDCWDVHESLQSANPDFIVVDVRGPNAFAKGHVEGAINIPHREITAARMADYPKGKMFVAYCAGPHCNGANKAALHRRSSFLPAIQAGQDAGGGKSDRHRLRGL
jgi:rhodanese-related sulfurtransferase